MRTSTAMKNTFFTSLLILALGAQPALNAGARENSAAAERAVSESISAALQGDAVRARDALVAIPADEFSEKDGQYRECMRARFASNSPAAVEGVDDPFVREILSIYQAYWHHALMAPSRRDALAEELRGKLGKFVGVDVAKSGEWETLEQTLADRLRERGHYSQLGKTPPLRELMIWRKQNSKMYDVELPEGSHQVRVEMLDEFVTLGWSSYARCGRGSNGGWVGEDRVYAVMPAFSDEGSKDAFHASLLVHEAQHFADKAHFPGLESWELEYRAKLAELWAAQQRLPKLLRSFAGSQSDDKESPHTFANKRVMSGLKERLRQNGYSTAHPTLVDVDGDAVRSAARDELIEDTRKRETKAGQPTTGK